jgi:thioredoxin-like negative regulator of GroEL
MIFHRDEGIKPATANVVSQVKSAFGHHPAGYGASHDSLAQARSAYANGDIDSAENAYKSYMRRDTDNADVHGELGNMYYASGKLSEAGQSYYDAANRLIAQNRFDQAKTLLPLINQTNPDLATELASRIEQAENQQTTSIAQNNLNQPEPALPQSALRYY